MAQANLENSINNYIKMYNLTTFLGLTFSAWEKLDSVQNSSIFGRLPQALQRGFVLAAARAALRRLTPLDSNSPRGDRARERFRSLLPGQAPHYRFLGLDLGFSYRVGAVIPESSPRREASNLVTDYLPTTWPGSRLPHLQVRRGTDCISLHDIINTLGFLLLTHAPEHDIWLEALRSIQDAIAMPVTCLSIGRSSGADLVDEQGGWELLSETSISGAVLVRPDGHVAWRCIQRPEEPAELLRTVFHILGCYG